MSVFDDTNKYKRLIVVGIMAGIALVHILRVGSRLNGRWHELYYSYFSDIVIPFGVYFLLCLSESRFPFLRKWHVKSALVFSLAAFAEICQGFRIPILGSTFDPLDFVMFGIGVLLAVLVEKYLLENIFSFWKMETNIKQLPSDFPRPAE